MRVKKVVDGKLVPVPGPGDITSFVGELVVSGKAPDGGPWVVAIGYAVLRGCSVRRVK